MIKTKTKLIILLTAFLIGVIFIGFNSQLDAYKIDTSTPKHYENSYKGIKGYVSDKAAEAGLDPLDIMSIISCESKFNPNAIGVNTNGTADLGTIQVNSIHIKSGSISIKCAGSPRCSIDWMIAKRLKDGNYNAWTCSKFIK